MSKLEELIEKYCSEGVEYYQLDNVFDLRNGYTPSKSNSAYWTNGTVPWYRMEDIRLNGRILSDSIQHITKEAVKGGKYFVANSILLATTATIGEHALLLTESLANQQFTNLKVKDSYKEKINMKYFYYYMFVIDDWCKKNTNVSGFFSVDMSKLKKIEIPIPRIEVQEEIARILDDYTEKYSELQSSLEEELQLRKEEYEYYRENVFLLKSEKEKNNYLKLKDCIISLKTGLNPRKNFRLNQDGAEYPYITGKDIYNNQINVTRRTDKIDQKTINLINKRADLSTGDLLFASTGTGTVGRMAIINDYNNKWAISETLYSIRIKRDVVGSKYLMYFLYSDSAIQQYSPKISKGSVPHLKIADLLDVNIPVPSMKVQQRIVDILDRYTEAYTELVEKIESEIRVREEEYEYYRDKLLTFKRKAI